MLVSAPDTGVVVYDADGTEVSRTPVDIPAAEIAAMTGVTPALTIDGTTIGDAGHDPVHLIGSHLLAMSSETVEVTVTVTPTPTTTRPPTAPTEPYRHQHRDVERPDR